MTTIAYKDGILAADTQLTYSGGVSGTSRKLELLSDGRVVAIAGDVTQEYWFKQVLQGVKIPKKKYKFKGIQAIIIDGTKVYQCWDGPELIDVGDSYLAIGHGHSIARAGMAIGMTAKQAVKMAGEVNIYTNTIVDTYDADKKKFTYGK